MCLLSSVAHGWFVPVTSCIADVVPTVAVFPRGEQWKRSISDGVHVMTDILDCRLDVLSTGSATSRHCLVTPSLCTVSCAFNPTTGKANSLMLKLTPLPALKQMEVSATDVIIMWTESSNHVASAPKYNLPSLPRHSGRIYDRAPDSRRSAHFGWDRPIILRAWCVGFGA